MICKPCQRAADFAASNLADDAKRLGVALVIPSHVSCKGGTWCDCQCKPPSTGRARS